MTAEQKQEFTRRISMSNRTGLIVILLEMLQCYLQDAADAGEPEEFKDAIRKAQQVLRRLEDDLNFKYELSVQLMQLYLFSQRELSLAMARRSKEIIQSVQRIIQPLLEAFTEVAKKDNSPVLMTNTQQVYVGMTYHKGVLSENIGADQPGRGYYA